MPEFSIVVAGVPRSTIDASDEDHAIARWLDMNGYEGLGDAASECFCKEDEIVAESLDDSDRFVKV